MQIRCSTYLEFTMRAYYVASIVTCAPLASAFTTIDDSNLHQAFSMYNDDITGALSTYGGIEGTLKIGKAYTKSSDYASTFTF